MQKTSTNIFIFFIFTLLFPAAEVFSATIALPMSNSGLIGYWNMEEASGATLLYDRSGRGNTGIMTNGPVATTSATGLGQALSFDGTDDYISVPNNSSLNGLSQITISLWIYPTSMGACWCDVVSKETADYGDAGYGIRISNGSNPVFTINIGASKKELVSSDNYNLNQWQHIVGVYDGSMMYIYKDGVLVGTQAQSGSIADSVNNLNIGRRVSAGDRNITGKLDEVRVYNRALSADEVSRLYKMQKARVVGGTSNTGLIGYWKFDEGSGTRAEDSSFSANKGTLVNGPTWTTGKNGKAVGFDGSNDYISVSNSTSLQITSSLTVSAWIKVASHTGAHREILRKGNNYFLDLNSTNKIALSTSNVASEFNNGFLYPADNLWHLVTGTFNGTSCRLYLDGVFQISYGCATPVSDSFGLGIGALYDGGTQFFSGGIDEVRVYNRNLSDTEVSALYKGSKAIVINKTNTNRLTNGLVGYWTFDGAKLYGTTAYDSSTSGNNGTLTNGPSIAVGKTGQALNFDGVNDYVTAGDSNLYTFTGDFTISCWINPKRGGTSFFWGCVSKANTGGNREWELGFDPTQSNAVRFLVGDSNGDWSLDMVRGAGTSLNNWHHIVGMVSGGVGYVFIDGVQSGSSSSYSSSMKNTTAPLYIGNVNTFETQSAFNGAIDEVRVYNRALSADEVKTLYTMGK